MEIQDTLENTGRSESIGDLGNTENIGKYGKYGKHWKIRELCNKSKLTLEVKLGNGCIMFQGLSNGNYSIISHSVP
jgi:hypothetical protein